MTLPAFKAVGTGSTTAPAWPTHVAGDFALLVTETTSGTVTTPSGWTAITPPFPISNAVGAGTVQHVFYRFATSSSETAPTLAGGSNHIWGVVITYTGVNPLHPIHAISTQVNAKNALSSPVTGGTTYLDTCLAVLILTWSLSQATAMISSVSSSGLGSVTKRYDAGTISGDGGGVAIADGTMASAGTFTDGVWVMNTNTRTCLSTIVLAPTDKSFGVKSRIINTGM